MTPSGDSERSKSPKKRPGKGGAERGRPQAGRGRHPEPSSQDAGAEERGILTNLPSTRPQRPSARRAAAKRAATERAKSGTAEQPTTTKRAKRGTAPTTTKRTKRGTTASDTAKRANRNTTARPASTKRATAAASGRRTTPPPPPPLEPPVPPQGFEDEIEPGTPIQPPSRPEVAGALAELVGELAQTGIARSGRLLRDALSRLPGI